LIVFALKHLSVSNGCLDTALNGHFYDLSQVGNGCVGYVVVALPSLENFPRSFFRLVYRFVVFHISSLNVNPIAADQFPGCALISTVRRL
jgi:hypothetical protein